MYHQAIVWMCMHSWITADGIPEDFDITIRKEDLPSSLRLLELSHALRQHNYR